MDKRILYVLMLTKLSTSFTVVGQDVMRNTQPVGFSQVDIQDTF